MTIIKKVLLKVLNAFFNEQDMRKIGVVPYFQYFFFQRILRINAKVPWMVHWSSLVTNSHKIKVGKSKYYPGFMPGCYINAFNGINIGANVLIGPGVKIISANHDLEIFSKATRNKSIQISDNCWIAANAIILPGVTLQEHTIVAAGAVVSKSFFQKNIIIAGVPAKIVKKIPSYKEV